MTTTSATRFQMSSVDLSSAVLEEVVGGVADATQTLKIFRSRKDKREQPV